MGVIAPARLPHACRVLLRTLGFIILGTIQLWEMKSSPLHLPVSVPVLQLTFVLLSDLIFEPSSKDSPRSLYIFRFLENTRCFNRCGVSRNEGEKCVLTHGDQPDLCTSESGLVAHQIFRGVLNTLPERNQNTLQVECETRIGIENCWCVWHRSTTRRQKHPVSMSRYLIMARIQ